LLWSQGKPFAVWLYRTNRVIIGLMTNSFARSPAAAMGALLAVATIPLHLLLSKKQSEQFAAVLLAACGAIYIGFSLQKGNLAQIATELTVATGFIAPHWRVFGLLRGSFRLPGRRMKFGIMRTTRVQGSHPYPQGSSPYPYGGPFCAFADWVVAASLAVMWGLRV
jgi:hypothetical protein